MLVEDDRVVARGPEVGGPSDETIDLTGRTLQPAFIDAHCHVLPFGLNLTKLSLDPFRSADDVLQAVRERHASHPDGWLLAVQYDQNRFVDGVHLHRSQLDAISSTRPILLRHANGHSSVANTAALELAGVTPSTPDPEGGEFVRDAAGDLTGVLHEIAHEMVHAKVPKPDLPMMVDAILAAGRVMRSRGIACASDMMTGVFDLDMELEAYRVAAEKGAEIRTRLYIQWRDLFGPRAIARERLAEHMVAMNPSRCRVAGAKIFADGAIASATAAIYGSYTGARPSGRVISRHAREVSSEAAGTEVSGQLIYSPERLSDMVRTANDAGYVVSVHSIGDYATDLTMDAFAATDQPSRHRIEHAMIMSDSQIERMANLGIRCAFQPEFIHALGHAYMRQLGPDRASKLKRARSVIDAGIPLSFNSDAPVVNGDPETGIRTAVARPEGFDPAENVTFAEALRAYTIEGAWVNDDDDQGALEPGMWADIHVKEL